MKTTVINGNKLAEKIKDKIVEEVLELNKLKTQNAEIRPNLAVILIGDNSESELYVSKKIEEAKKVGIDTHLYRFFEDDSEDDIVGAIKVLNKDDEIDAILVQLPLSKKFDTDRIIKEIDPKKDVDCFHPDNQGKEKDLIISPVHGAVLEILNKAKYNIEDKKILIIANSKIFSQNLKKILTKKNAVVKESSANNPELKKELIESDLVISAVGKPFFINNKMLKEGAGIIDIGISREGKKIKGDFEFIDSANEISFYTPVPGGVGPLTVAVLLKNTLELAKLKK